VVLLKLVRVKVVLLSPLFLPISPIHTYWDVTHDHIPPTTFSGFVLRAILSVVDPKNLTGDYIPHRPDEGLLVELTRSKLVCEWCVAKRKEVVNGFKPPYIEYHFRAVSLGAYPESLLRGDQPNVGVVDKYWNVLKYIDRLEDIFNFGIKTWHYVAIKRGGQFYEVYDVVKVKHKVITDSVYGFILIDDRVVEKYFERLMKGWFIYRLGMKNLIAVRVEEIMGEVKEDRVDYVLPFLTIPNKRLYSFTSTILDINALKGLRRDISVIKDYLHVSNDPMDELDRLILFRDKEFNVYGVDKKWLNYLV